MVLITAPPSGDRAVQGGAVTNLLRVVVEIGPKGKKVVAIAPDWPGLSRGAKTEELALERLQAYLPRYAPIAKLAGLETEFATATDLDVVERYPGTGSTDFWGISYAHSEIDKQSLTSEALDRDLALMQASWAFFDSVRTRVSEEMQKGPRGGGRDRDHIIRHTLLVEDDWSPQVGVPRLGEAVLTEEGLNEHRTAYVNGFREYHAAGKSAGKSPLHYLIRHTAFHTLDHAWEMEDKDLTDKTT